MSEQSKAAIETFLNMRYQLKAETIDWSAPISKNAYIDSLAMIDFLTHMEKQLSVELPLIELLENFPPTLMALIDYIDDWKR